MKPRKRDSRLESFVILAFLSISISIVLAAPTAMATIWTGPTISFRQGDPADSDIILPGIVEITRDARRGIYNRAAEPSNVALSPADTLWAFDANNSGSSETIAASNFGNLRFDTWITAHGRNPLATLDRPGVLYIVSADIYLDIKFTEWGRQGAGGFAYERSTIPEPSSAVMLILGLLCLGRSSILTAA